MSEELASIREVVDLSPPHALDEAEYFLVGQGYVVVNRTATTLTVERDGSESITSQESTPKLMVMAVPQPDGGVKIKVRGTDREGMRQQQARWTEWADGLPKRQPPPKVRVKFVSQSSRRRRLLSASVLVLVMASLALILVVVLLGLAISDLSEPEDANEVVQRLEAEGMPIGESKAYSAENDPNELLGRPGQYTSKVIFKDTRLKPNLIASEFDVQNGGSVEVFENEADAIRRQGYLEAVTEGLGGPFSEYAYRQDTVLLRLSPRLTLGPSYRTNST